MRNDLSGQFVVYTISKELLDALKTVFADTSMTRLRQLQMHFEYYNWKYFRAEYLTKMSMVIREMLPIMFLHNETYYDVE